jgi:hypothetical protein
MIVVAGVALALLVLALAGAGQGPTSEQIVTRMVSEKDPRIVAAAAQVLEGRGMTLTAEALRARARDLSGGAISGGETASGWRPAPEEVAPGAWRRFVRVLKAGSLGARSPSGRLGLFSIHLHRLAELGYVRRVRRTAAGTLEAEWLEPLTEAAFLSNPRLQYQALTESMAGLTEEIARRYPSAVGRLVDGRPASLSGLLAVAHRLGLSGLARWLGSSGERARQRIASAAFERANGIF